MKISRTWLQTYFTDPLPDAAAIGDALTFHAFEIETIENDILDVKVTANRGHDCLSHRGIAKELAAILNIPLRADPLRAEAVLAPMTDRLQVVIDEPSLCRRYIAGSIRGVTVGPSPAWLREALESMGQRSINNVVDATNYVMFDIGQPLHAFDAAQLSGEGGGHGIRVRKATLGERMVALDDKEYEFNESMLLITDAHTDRAIGIAGVKGGKPASITEATRDIIIESAHFDGISVRKTAQALKLRTDASARFEQGVSAELPAYGMKAALKLITDIAGGAIEGCADLYPIGEAKQEARVSSDFVSTVLGATFLPDDVSDVFRRLDLAHTEDATGFTVHVPFERLDLSRPEDLVEEVARLKGYEHVPSAALPPLPTAAPINSAYRTIELLQDFLTERGFSEVYTSVFAESGERVVANKVDGVRPFLRDSLVPGLSLALEKNMRNKDLLGLRQVKLFEIGAVWKDGQETFSLCIAVEKAKKTKSASDHMRDLLELFGSSESIPDGPSEVLAIPLSLLIGDSEADGGYRGAAVPNTRYKPFSKYPFIVRDIALWTPEATEAGDVAAVIAQSAGDLLARIDLFDRFEKDGKVSYAFRLVFQSYDKTLTDFEANERMESVGTAATQHGWIIR